MRQRFLRQWHTLDLVGVRHEPTDVAARTDEQHQQKPPPPVGSARDSANTSNPIRYAHALTRNGRLLMNAPEDEILALPTALFPRRTRARVGARGEPEIHKQSVKGGL